MPLRKTWLQHPFFCIAQHIAFWALSFIVFIRFFKSGASADKVDLIYTPLFHITVLPAVYIHLYWLLPFTSRIRGWLIYLFCAGALVLCFSWLNYMFFEDWSKYLLKDYFFISY